ncbi:MAG: stage 0 sporulation family protein [Armatimonadaceae bacterium]
MPLLAGITFRKMGKIHYYPADGFLVEAGTFVIAETERGLEYGEVKLVRTVEGKLSEIPHLFRIVRLATESDRRTMERLQKDAEEGLLFCQERADSLRLPMKLVEAEAAWDGQQFTFYFVSEARVDFRQLVKDVAARLKTRIHLHQVGARDHAKSLGGYGPCGRPLCCTTFLRDFAPVSMKMAKDQSLYLNPSKFSGVCGKLMCCLRYEHDIYLEARRDMPDIGMTVSLPSGARGVVTQVDVFNKRLTVQIHDEEGMTYRTVPAQEATVARACGDCGSVGGGCGTDGCASTCGSANPATPPALIQLEISRPTATRSA